MTPTETTKGRRFSADRDKEREKNILSSFSAEQQKEIVYKKDVLSSLMYLIGKDFKMPVEYNEPKKGWHWDFQNNVVRVDPQDLLEKSMDQLRFLFSHEAGHRRISRTDFIPRELLRTPGFMFMFNAVEDPRDNNFVADVYPKFKEQAITTYENQFLEEAKAKVAGKLAFQPRFMQAGFEYIKQWFRELKGQPFEIDTELPPEVQTVVEETLAAAQESWWRYPSREEADSGEELIERYAQAAHQINHERIWPKFKKLAEMDMLDAQAEQTMREIARQIEKQKGEKPVLPPELEKKLTPEEKELLETILKEFIDAQAQEESPEQKEGNEEGGTENSSEEKDISEKSDVSAETPIDGPPKKTDISKIPDELKKKIRDYLKTLEEELHKKILEETERIMAEVERILNEELQGKLTQDPAEQSEEPHSTNEKNAKISRKKNNEEAEFEEEERNETEERERQKQKEEFKEQAKKLRESLSEYDKYREEVLPLINSLENDLRQIFTARRSSRWETGYKAGKRIDIKKRIQEKAKGVSAVESRAWQKRELPQEKDYAITLLVDLSGSMQEEDKIKETFKAVVLLSEVLNRLSIKIEILGFNSALHEFQNFGDKMSPEIRKKIPDMLTEVTTFRAGYNDDGWALQEASKRLKRQQADQKLLLVFSDGQPAPTYRHEGAEFDLNRVVSEIIRKEKDQKLIGLGVGRGTRHVKEYYPRSLANIDVKQMAKEIAKLIKDIIEHPEDTHI